MKKAVTVVVLAVVAGGLLAAGCTLEEDVQREIAYESPVATISALELWEAYDNNEVAADERFEDKVVIVTGIVENIGKDIADTPYVTLRTKHYGGDTYASNVQCMFADTASGTLGQLQPGQELKIKGQVRGSTLGRVLLRGCTIY